MKIIKLYPKLFNDEYGVKVGCQVTLEEIKEVLKKIIKEKILDLDGWTVEFFLHLFDLIGQDILMEVEESRKKDFIFEKLNSTYITLIPKKDKP